MGEIMVANGVRKVFGSGEGQVVALKDVSFTINRGELAIILGPSGAGKSTLLNLIGGMDVVTSGSLLVDGEDIGHASRKELTEYRRTKIGFVFQFYNLMPNLTARRTSSSRPSLRRTPSRPTRYWIRSACRIGRTISHPSFREASSSGFRWPGLWPRTPISSSAMSRPGPWTTRPARKY